MMTTNTDEGLASRIGRECTMRLYQRDGFDSMPFVATLVNFGEAGIEYEMDNSRWFTPWQNVVYIGFKVQP